MPPIAGAILFIGEVVGNVGLVVAIANTVFQVAIFVGLSELSKALSGKPKSGIIGTQSRDVTVKGTVEPRQLIYGQARTGGVLAFYGCSGSQNRYLWFVVAVAGHQCEDISDCWLGPTMISNSNIDASTGVVNQAEVKDGSTSYLNIWKHLGTGNQTYDTNIFANFSEWSTNHRGLGCAYVVYRLDRSEKVWSTGAPNTFYHLVKGRRLYDPRKDSTNGGSGSHRVTDATTWEWSNNSALAVRDYITGGAIEYTTTTPDKRLTIGESDSRIDDPYTIAAANICDENVFIPPGSPITTQKRYTCDTQLSCGVSHLENLQTLNSSMIGHLSYAGGKYRIFAGAYDIPSVSLTADDLLGPINVATHPQGEDNYNLVTGTFYDEDRSWQQATFPAQTSSTYETDDGGQQTRDIELLSTRTSWRAQRIAFVILNQSRNKQIVKFSRLSPKAMNISEWETFNVSIPEYGWNPQVMRCMEWQFLPEGFISITARIEGSSAYADPLVGAYKSPTTSTSPAPQIETPSPATSLVAIGYLQGIEFTATLPSFNPSSNVYELWEHTSSTPFSSAVKIAEYKSNIFTLSKNDFVTRYYWVTIGSTNGRRSAEYPSGAGVSGSRVANPQDLSIVPDPEFSRAIDDTYWIRSKPSKMVISPTGGLITGLITFDFNETFATGATRVLKQNRPLLVWLVNDDIEVALRYRRTSAISSPNDKKLQVEVYSFQFSDESGSSNPEATIDIEADMSSLTLNTWKEKVITITSAPHAYPFIRVRIIGVVNGTGPSTGTLDIDYIRIRVI